MHVIIIGKEYEDVKIKKNDINDEQLYNVLYTKIIT